MITELLDSSAAGLARAAELLRMGKLVAVPTETVYGLAADIRCESALREIFTVKGRPSDNPLIVHVDSPAALAVLCRDVPESAYTLAERFWPGPLTMVLKRGAVPDAVTAGLDTVAIRCPAHPAALEIIRRLAPFAAPSANISGTVSPTSMFHVMADLDGKIAAIIDGGECEVGLESTIVSLVGDKPRLLRPGAVTLEDLRAVLGMVETDKAISAELGLGERAQAPGMKYRHYAPKSKLVVVKGSPEAFSRYVKAQSGRKAVLCFEGEEELVDCERVAVLGTKTETQARLLYAALRRLDMGADSVIYARCPESEGLGMAVANRLMKASGFTLVDAEL